MSLWYGERTLVLARDLVLARHPGKTAELAEWIKGFDRYRLKAHDLISFLKARPWLSRPALT